MSSNSPEERRRHLLNGLDYLRRHALEAHRAGDGLQVNHYCSLALQGCLEHGKAHPDQKVGVAEVRWACIFGMYWIVNEYFLILVRSALEHCDCAGRNATDNELIVIIHNRLQLPQDPISLGDTDAIPEEWWKERALPNSPAAEEDVVALSFAIELVWYFDPESDDWRKLIEKWTECIPAENVLMYRITQLLQRLEFQKKLYSGTAFHSSEQDLLQIEDDIQRDLFRGWMAD